MVVVLSLEAENNLCDVGEDLEGVLVATYPSSNVGGLCNDVVGGSSRPWVVPPLWSNVRGLRNHLFSHT